MPSEEPQPSSMSELAKRRSAKTKRVALREVAWLLGCVAAAAVFCLIAPEYGYDPVPFFAVCFYLMTGIVRLFLRYFVRWLSRLN
jgi:hypothetical protein